MADKLMTDDPLPPGATDLLSTGELSVLGRIMPASNQTFLCRLGPEESGLKAVYKPVAGEQPLWDFSDGTLANREYAAYLVSEALGWSVVPPTVLRDGPAGPGMVQLWCEPDPGVNAVDIVPAGTEATGYLKVLDAQDNLDRLVTLVHEDTPALRRMALFDLIVNNTDRKGGHVLAMASGHRYGVDHGVCFHAEDKLRTVLWGWAGQPLHADERAAVEALATEFNGGTGSPGALGEQLALLLTREEIEQTCHRINRLLVDASFAEPGEGWPSLPWPPF